MSMFILSQKSSFHIPADWSFIFGWWFASWFIDHWTKLKHGLRQTHLLI